MAKKSNKLKFILIISILLILIVGIGLFSTLQSVLGVSSDLDYSNRWKNQDLAIGSYSSEATVNLPKDTSVFSFTPKYDFRTYKNSGEDVNIDIKYEVFNYNSNSWEIVLENNWNLRNDYGEQNKFKMDGESVYNNGIPEHLESMNVQRGSYERYYGCLDGMNINEAKELNPWIEGTSSYSYKCLYPGNTIIKHEYDDDSDENWDIEYFPKIITLDKKYIFEDKSLFKISVNVKSSGIDSIYAEDFEIEFWKVETGVVDTYAYSEQEGVCNYKPKYTYQVTQSDYFTRNECNYNNSVIECYKDNHCLCDEELVSDCDNGICICEKENILDKIFPDKEEEENIKEIFPEGSESDMKEIKSDINYISMVFLITISALIILIVSNITKKRKKKR